MTIHHAHRRTLDLEGNVTAQATAQRESVLGHDGRLHCIGGVETGRILFVLRKVVRDRMPSRLGAHEHVTLRLDAEIALEIAGRDERHVDLGNHDRRS